jgi:hypothetical protein
MVLGSGAHHGGPSDVDVLDARRGHKGIQIRNHQIDGGDVSFEQLLHMRLLVPVRQDPTVDSRVQRLDTAVEHLIGASHLTDGPRY